MCNSCLIRGKSEPEGKCNAHNKNISLAESGFDRNGPACYDNKVNRGIMLYPQSMWKA